MRVAASTCASGALARSVFADQNLPQNVRVQVAEASAFSVLLYGAGIWSKLTNKQHKMLSAAQAKPLRRIAGCHKPPVEGAKWTSNEEVRRALGVPEVVIVIAMLRVKLAARMSLRAPRYVIAMAQSVGAASWRGQVIAGLSFMREALRPKLDSLGDPVSCVAQWEEFWISWPHQWKQLAKATLKWAAVEPQEAASLAVKCGLMATINAGHETDEELLCVQCGKVFPSSRALLAHQAVAHQRRRPARDFVVTRFCPVCKGDYRSRLRAMAHVERGSVLCRQALDSGQIPRADPQVVREADDRDAAARRKARADGTCVTAGLPYIKGRI